MDEDLSRNMAKNSNTQPKGPGRLKSKRLLSPSKKTKIISLVSDKGTTHSSVNNCSKILNTKHLPTRNIDTNPRKLNLSTSGNSENLRVSYEENSNKNSKSFVKKSEREDLLFTTNKMKDTSAKNSFKRPKKKSKSRQMKNEQHIIQDLRNGVKIHQTLKNETPDLSNNINAGDKLLIETKMLQEQHKSENISQLTIENVQKYDEELKSFNEFDDSSKTLNKNDKKKSQMKPNESTPIRYRRKFSYTEDSRVRKRYLPLTPLASSSEISEDTELSPKKHKESVNVISKKKRRSEVDNLEIHDNSKLYNNSGTMIQDDHHNTKDYLIKEEITDVETNTDNPNNFSNSFPYPVRYTRSRSRSCSRGNSGPLTITNKTAECNRNINQSSDIEKYVKQHPDLCNQNFDPVVLIMRKDAIISENRVNSNLESNSTENDNSYNIIEPKFCTYGQFKDDSTFGYEAVLSEIKSEEDEFYSATQTDSEFEEDIKIEEYSSSDSVEIIPLRDCHIHLELSEIKSITPTFKADSCDKKIPICKCKGKTISQKSSLNNNSKPVPNNSISKNNKPDNIQYIKENKLKKNDSDISKSQNTEPDILEFSDFEPDILQSQNHEPDIPQYPILEPDIPQYPNLEPKIPQSQNKKQAKSINCKPDIPKSPNNVLDSKQAKNNKQETNFSLPHLICKIQLTEELKKTITATINKINNNETIVSGKKKLQYVVNTSNIMPNEKPKRRYVSKKKKMTPLYDNHINEIIEEVLKDSTSSPSKTKNSKMESNKKEATQTKIVKPDVYNEANDETSSESPEKEIMELCMTEEGSFYHQSIIDNDGDSDINDIMDDVMETCTRVSPVTEIQTIFERQSKNVNTEISQKNEMLIDPTLNKTHSPEIQLYNVASKNVEINKKSQKIEQKTVIEKKITNLSARKTNKPKISQHFISKKDNKNEPTKIGKELKLLPKNTETKIIKQVIPESSDSKLKTAEPTAKVHDSPKILSNKSLQKLNESTKHIRTLQENVQSETYVASADIVKIHITKDTKIITKSNTKIIDNEKIFSKKVLPNTRVQKLNLEQNISNIPLKSLETNVTSLPTDLRQLISEKRAKDNEKTMTDFSNKYKNVVIQTSPNSKKVLVTKPLISINSQQFSNTDILSPKILKTSPVIESKIIKTPEIKINLFGKTFVRGTTQEQILCPETLDHPNSGSGLKNVMSQKLTEIYKDRLQKKVFETKRTLFKGSTNKVLEPSNLEKIQVTINNDLKTIIPPVLQNEVQNQKTIKINQECKIDTNLNKSPIREKESNQEKMNITIKKEIKILPQIEKAMDETNLKKVQVNTNDKKSPIHQNETGQNQGIMEIPLDQEFKNNINLEQPQNRQKELNQDRIKILAINQEIKSKQVECEIKKQIPLNQEFKNNINFEQPQNRQKELNQDRIKNLTINQEIKSKQVECEIKKQIPLNQEFKKNINLKQSQIRQKELNQDKIKILTINQEIKSKQVECEIKKQIPLNQEFKKNINLKQPQIRQKELNQDKIKILTINEEIKSKQVECETKKQIPEANVTQTNFQEFGWKKPKHTFKFIEKCNVKRPPSRQHAKITLKRPKLDLPKQESPKFNPQKHETTKFDLAKYESPKLDPENQKSIKLDLLKPKTPEKKSEIFFKIPSQIKTEMKFNRQEPLHKPVDDDVISILADPIGLESVFDVASVRNEDLDYEDEFKENVEGTNANEDELNKNKDDSNGNIVNSIVDESFTNKERFTQIKKWLDQSVEDLVPSAEQITPPKKHPEIPIARVNPGIQKPDIEEQKLNSNEPKPNPEEQISNSTESNKEERIYKSIAEAPNKKHIDIFKNMCRHKLKENYCSKHSCHYIHLLPQDWQNILKNLPVNELMRVYNYLKEYNLFYFYKIMFPIVAGQLGAFKDFNNLTTLVKDVLEIRMNTDREPLIKDIIQALIDTGFTFYSTVEFVFISANVEQNLKNLLCDILLNLTVERKQLEDNWPIIQMLSVHKQYDIDKGIIQFIIIETLAKNYLHKDIIVKVYADLIKKIPDFNMKTISATLFQKFIEMMRKHNLQSDSDELYFRCISLNILEKHIIRKRDSPKLTQHIPVPIEEQNKSSSNDSSKLSSTTTPNRPPNQNNHQPTLDYSKCTSQYQQQSYYPNRPQMQYQASHDHNLNRNPNQFQQQQLQQLSKNQQQQKYQLSQNQHNPFQLGQDHLNRSSNYQSIQEYSNRQKNPKIHPLIPGLRADKNYVNEQYYSQSSESTPPPNKFLQGNFNKQDQQLYNQEKINNYPVQSSSSGYSSSSKEHLTSKNQIQPALDLEPKQSISFDRFLNCSMENLELLANTASESLSLLKEPKEGGEKDTFNLSTLPFNISDFENKTKEEVVSPLRVDKPTYQDQSYPAIASNSNCFPELRQLVIEENYAAIMQLILLYCEGLLSDSFLNCFINSLLDTHHNYPTFFSSLSDIAANSNNTALSYMLRTIGVNLIIHLCQKQQFEPAFRVNFILLAKYKQHSNIYDIYNCKLYIKENFSYFKRILIIAKMYIVKGDIQIAWHMLRDNALSNGIYWHNNHERSELMYRNCILKDIFEAFGRIKNCPMALDVVKHLVMYKNPDINIKSFVNSIFINAISSKCNFDKIEEIMIVCSDWYTYIHQNTFRAILITAYTSYKNCVYNLYDIGCNLFLYPHLIGNEKTIFLSVRYHSAEIQLVLDRFFHNMMNHLPLKNSIVIKASSNNKIAHLHDEVIPSLTNHYSATAPGLVTRITNILQNNMQPSIEVHNRNNVLYLEPEKLNPHLLSRLQSSHKLIHNFSP